MPESTILLPPTVLLIDEWSTLREFESLWNSLAKHPLQRTEWYGQWWNQFGEDHQLCILTVVADGDAIGFAPWYVDKRVLGGSVIRFLGSGKACTDHQSLICQPGRETQVADAIAQWLANSTAEAGLQSEFVWHQLELDGVDQNDSAIGYLKQSFENLGMRACLEPGDETYELELPESTEDYKRSCSKNGKRQINKCNRQLESDSTFVFLARSRNDIAQVWDDFVWLHQRRRHQLDEQGCFDNENFTTFLRSATLDLAAQGMAELWCIYIDNEPASAQLCFLSNETTYFYQSGMNPDFRDRQPGSLAIWSVISNSIERGAACYDLMRGDEPYKARWKAQAKPSVVFSAVSNQTSAKVRVGIEDMLQSGKQRLKTALGR